MKTSIQKKVAILDYGMGNLFSVKLACESVGISTHLTSDKNEIAKMDGLILPGVGAFADAMETLTKLDLLSPIRDFIHSKKPFMGICLGMQLLFTDSEEFGLTPGIGVLPGHVVRFLPKKNVKIRVPQVQWNQIHCPSDKKWQGSPLESLQNGSYMYFIHSYYVVPSRAEDILSQTEYEGTTYCSSVLSDNIFAVQFHPEKSATGGLSIYSKFQQSL